MDAGARARRRLHARGQRGLGGGLRRVSDIMIAAAYAAARPPVTAPCTLASERLVVIGNGMAGMRTVEELAVARAGALRHYRHRRRTGPELQPHPVVVGACRRQSAR